MIRAALAACLCLAPLTASAFTCHVALVLALDASDSVDRREADLQRRGLAEALKDPEVMAALTPYPGHGALLMAFEWADPGARRVIVEWAALDGAAAIFGIAAKLEIPPPVQMTGQTGLGAALDFAVAAHARAPADCARKVIDVSGDGPGNVGPAPSIRRRAGAFDGITINGLVIREDPADYNAQQPTRDPLPYYEAEVRHGPGAFVMTAASYDDYAVAIRRKLLRELRATVAVAEAIR